jgi:hypothetical protein
MRNLVRTQSTARTRAIALRVAPSRWVAFGYVTGPLEGLDRSGASETPFPGGGTGKTTDLRLWRLMFSVIRRD